MNISRRCLDGTVQPDDPLNQSQVFITTAGWKGTFPYNKLITLLVRMIVEPDKAFVMGGTWRIPVLVGLQNSDWLTNIKRDETYNETAFEREYESKWSGVAEEAFFDGEAFDRNRKLLVPETKSAIKNGSGSQSYYVIAVDVARKKGWKKYHALSKLF